MTLSAEDFLRRFVQHVLPKGFVKVRHYGLLAPRGRDGRLTLCRRLLLPATIPVPLSGGAGAVTLTQAREPSCAQCGGHRLITRELPKAVVPLPPRGDSS